MSSPITGKSQDTWDKLKLELLNKTLGVDYSQFTTASEIAIKLNEPVSMTPQQFILIPQDKIQVLASKLSPTMIDSIVAFAKLNGWVVTSDFTDIKQEIFTTRADLLGLGYVSQSDLEIALKP